MVLREIATLEEAVALAHAEAQAGESVIFSPGAPSFDAYHNFAERGEHFVQLVQTLEQPTPAKQGR